jgi:hypothetical protein
MVCKFWIAPVALAQNQGFSAQELNQIRIAVQANRPTRGSSRLPKGAAAHASQPQCFFSVCRWNEMSGLKPAAKTIMETVKPIRLH